MSPWLSLDDKDWEPILKDSSVKSYERSTVIYQQGDVTPYVYLVKEGRVVLDLYGINGRRRSIYIADKGTCFGELACLDQLGNYCTATTCTKTTLYLISKKRFTEEICQNPDFCMTLLKALSLKTRLITSLLEQMSFNDSNYRVYHSLLSLIPAIWRPSKRRQLQAEYQIHASGDGLSDRPFPQYRSRISFCRLRMRD